MMLSVRQIVSGGQTGADRAALDVALELSIDHFGWVPKGFTAEDGSIDQMKYPNLREATSAQLNERTTINVLWSDGTLIVSHGLLQGGSLFTLIQAEAHHKPRLHIDLDELTMPEAIAQIQEWLTSHKIAVLNVAGPRQSEDNRIYAQVKHLLAQLLFAPPSP
jgi:hypothetical protein